MRIPYLIMFSVLILAPFFLSAQKGVLFERLSPQKTGVKFNNKIKDTRDHNILIYSNYYGGGGVGIGDFNRDGLADIFFAGNLVNDALYLNGGNFKFTDITKSARILRDQGWSSGVVVADVNQDGWDDIYVTRELYDKDPDRRRNLLYINNKDLTFTESAQKYGIADTARTRHAVFFDYDRDGDLDLYCLNQPPNVGNYSPLRKIDKKSLEYRSRFYENKGDQFVDITQRAGLEKTGFPNSAVATDLDQDGWTDLYVANDYAAPDALYHNNGDGTFTNMIESATGHTSFYSMGVDAADMNNDGLNDLMVLDMAAEDNFRLKANMSGMDVKSFWEVVADGGHYQYMYNTLQLNRGKNKFSEIAQLAGLSSTDWSWSNLLADFDNDGLKDIHITNGLLRDIRNTDAEKEFGKYIVKQINEYITKNPDDGEVTIWDVINLEKALKIIPSQPLKNYAFRNRGNYQFENIGEKWGLATESFSNGSAYADLNNDGWLDLVVNNINDPAFIYKNNGKKRNENHYLRLVLEDKDRKATAASRIYLYRNGQLQFLETGSLHGMYSTSEDIAHFGLGKEIMVDSVLVYWPDGQRQKLNNIAADQTLTVKKVAKEISAAAKKNPLLDQQKIKGLDYQHQENIFDDYRFQVLLPHKLSQMGPAAATGDVNGDGLEDLFFGGACGQLGALYTQNTDGTFQKSTQDVWQEHSLCEDVDALFFDADMDGDLDLYIVSGGNEFTENSPFYGDRLYQNDGTGIFTISKDALPENKTSGSVIKTADIDQDGDLDLLVGGRMIPRDYPAPASSKILRNDQGTFTDITNDFAPFLVDIGLVTDAAFTDLNEDGKMDLLVVGEWMPIRAFEHQGDQLVEVEVLGDKIPKTGWWNSITVGDLDGDGDDDFVFGNLGLNYKYQASTDEPFEIFYGDFDGNQKKDIVLSYYNFGTQFPLRGRSCSSQQVPMLKEKFPQYNIFAKSALKEVYNPVMLDASLALKADNFSSMIGINTGNGKIELKPLPVEAQFSSINAAEIMDVDQDGHVDIVLAGNLFEAEIETPRSDAGLGLFLKGDGKGNFTAWSAAQSGISVDKEIRKIKVINIGGKPYFIFVSNDEQPVFLTTK